MPVPFGHADFGQLIRCACGRTLDTARAAARLGDELGDLAHCTFDTFDLARPLTPIYQFDRRYHRDLSRIPFERRHEAALLSAAVQAGALAAAYNACQSYAAMPSGWLCLHGAYGSGKSHLAAAVANTLVGRSWSVRYRSVPGMLDAIKAGFSDQTSDAIFDDLLSVDLLVLDDLGAQRLSGWGNERLFRLMNERLHRPTIITTNAHPDDLADASDMDAQRLADRIAQAARKVWLPISSYRRIGKEAAV